MLGFTQLDRSKISTAMDFAQQVIDAIDRPLTDAFVSQCYRGDLEEAKRVVAANPGVDPSEFASRGNGLALWLAGRAGHLKVAEWLIYCVSIV